MQTSLDTARAHVVAANQNLLAAQGRARSLDAASQRLHARIDEAALLSDRLAAERHAALFDVRLNAARTVAEDARAALEQAQTTLQTILGNSPTGLKLTLKLLRLARASNSLEECLARELREELGIEVAICELVETLTHEYPEKTVHLKFFRCRWERNEARPLGCSDFKWIGQEDLVAYDFPAADARLLDKLRSLPSF